MNPPSKPDGSLIFVDKGGKLTSPSLQMLQGFWQMLVGGTFASYTPTVSSGTGTITAYTVTGRYLQINKLVFFQNTINITTNGSGGSFLKTTLPTTANSDAELVGQDVSATGKGIIGWIIAGLAIASDIAFTDFTYPGANGVKIILSGCYESQ